MKKRTISLALALLLCLSLAVPALAADSDFVIYDNGTLLWKYNGSDKHVVIPDGITIIVDQAFMNNTSIESVYIPDSVTQICGWAFAGCTSLTSVSIPEGVEVIGVCAFADCTNLERVSIPESLLGIDNFAFSGCTSLKSITLPKNSQLAEVFNRDVQYLKKVFGASSAIEEFVNCNNEALLQIIAANEAVVTSGWINLGEHVNKQSERITAMSNQICAGLDSDYDKAKAVYEWVAANIEYDYEYFYGRKENVITSAEGVLDSRLTVCAGYSRLTQALLQAQDIPTLYIVGRVTDVRTPVTVIFDIDHAWNMAFVEGRWIYMDSTWGRPGKYDEATGELVDAGSTYDPTRFDPTTLNFSMDHWAESRFAADPVNTPSEWAQSEVRQAMYTGLIPYDLQAAYRNDITREEFCRLMVALVEQESGQKISDYLKAKGLSVTDPFTDTDNAAVLAAYALGIVNGTSDTTFSPNGSITRQEAAAMLSRTAKVLGLTTGKGETFADAGQFASWASESISFVSGLADPATGNKVMGGTGNGNFSPLATYTREQAVMTAMRLFNCAK